jgi:Uma2 family endonuclease
MITQPGMTIVIDTAAFSALLDASDAQHAAPWEDGIGYTPLERSPPRSMMMAIGYRFTVDDLASFPDDGRRREVIDGELHVSSAPHIRHQAVIQKLGNVLSIWSEAAGQGMCLPGPGLIFSVEDAVIPDLVWLSEEKLAHALRGDGKLHAAPDLVVEVLSPGPENEYRDRETKLKLYSARGVGEYWIVDPAARTVQVYRRQQAVLTLAATLTAEDDLTSPRLPGFRATVRDLFPRPDLNF